MRIRLIAVGKVKERGLRAAVDDYLGRIDRYSKVKEVELKDGPIADVEARFRKAIPDDRARVVALEVDGKSYSSARLAKFVGETQNRGVQTLCFLIGGADGLPPSVSAEADLRLSMSAMTLPHRLARLVLAEQVYRAFTILRNEPYDH
ncbi:MAG: 23S rRNA (pseudouridine(1915)-N(3))-methyltransferase RlmH [Deltaproteobacteria bacterium]|nr:23S rRNA (pseudouridine(1915)-N(3))-methyltransferase RlmH [Deltaproteobacteria bacterium]